MPPMSENIPGSLKLLLQGALLIKRTGAGESTTYDLHLLPESEAEIQKEINVWAGIRVEPSDSYFLLDGSIFHMMGVRGLPKEVGSIIEQAIGNNKIRFAGKVEITSMDNDETEIRKVAEQLKKQQQR